jgi:hypothetical protein
MKKIQVVKIAELGCQILPVLEGLLHHEGRDPWVMVYLWLGMIQTASCFLNRIFLKRVYRSPWRIVYELLLLVFYIVVFSGVFNRAELLDEDLFWVFCTAMAVLYGAISCHELWKMSRPEVVMLDDEVAQ